MSSNYLNIDSYRMARQSRAAGCQFNLLSLAIFLLSVMLTNANITVNMRNGTTLELDAVEIIYPGNMSPFKNGFENDNYEIVKRNHRMLYEPHSNTIKTLFSDLFSSRGIYLNDLLTSVPDLISFRFVSFHVKNRTDSRLCIYIHIVHLPLIIDL